MKHITTMGAVWRLSDRNLKRLIRDMAARKGGHDDLDNYGKMIIDRLWTLDELKLEAGIDQHRSDDNED